MTALADFERLDDSPAFRAVHALCERAEREIRLIDRAQPLNVPAERARLLADLRAGRAARAELTYSPSPELSSLRAELERASVTWDALGPLGQLYAARARELACEAELAEAIGAPDFAARAGRRFPADSGVDGRAAEQMASEWAQSFSGQARGSHCSDDERDAESLLSVLRRRALELGLRVRVEVRATQAAAASVGDGFIAVRPGLWHTASEVARIALHELEGHALPRMRARSERLALFRIGSAQSSEDEEGRALWLEERAGLCDAARKAELALRHLTARAARDGASFAEAAALLCALGAEPERVVDTALRAYRGGGLGRELCYLVALSRVSRAFAEEPALAAWLARGRVSIAAARVLERSLTR
jgi:hypothetical protein